MSEELRDLTVEELMDATEGAYARLDPGITAEEGFYFPEGEWRMQIILLKMAGYTGVQIQVILRSKYARWARDSGKTLVDYINDARDRNNKGFNRPTGGTFLHCSMEEINSMVENWDDDEHPLVWPKDVVETAE
jgi:hypothetical protein